MKTGHKREFLSFEHKDQWKGEERKVRYKEVMDI